MREQLLKMLGGRNGGQLLTGTGATAGDWDALIVHTDAVIEILLVDGVNVTTTPRNFNTQTLVAGTFIGAGAGKKITSVKLTSGTVMAY